MKFLNDLGYSARSLRRDPAKLLVLLECAAVVNPVLSMLLANHHFNTMASIFDHGEDRPELADVIDDLDSLRAVGTFVITEIGHGNSHTRLKTEGRYDRSTGDFVLHTPDPSARKFMAANSLPGVAKHGVVIARLLDGDLDYGTFPFLVPLRTENAARPGIDIRPMPESANTLCELLRPHALSLVEAFGLPDHVLRAPMSTDDYPATLISAARPESDWPQAGSRREIDVGSGG